MKVRKKILLSNLAAIVITTSIMIIVLAILSISFKNLTGLSLEKIKEQKNSRGNIEKSLDRFVSNVEYAQSAERREASYNILKDNLSELGYRVEIRVDGRVKNSNLTSEDQKLLDDIGYYDKSPDRANTISIEGKNIIKRNIPKKGSSEVEEIILVSEVPKESQLDIDLTFERFISYTALFIVITLVLLFFTNTILAEYLSAYILNPLDRLKYGTEKLKNGDYDYTVDYPNRDEFGEVIWEFNDMKEKLKNSEMQKELYEKDRRELIAGISHDLRTPLTSIKGYSKGILDGIANTDEKKQKYVEKIYQKADELESLINILYTYSRLESGSMSFNFEEVEFISYVKDKAAEFQGYRGGNIESEYCGVEKEKVYLSLDRNQFDRIMFNIVENSLKYGKKSDDDILHMKFKTEIEDENICLEIKDSGPGVEEDKLDKIFEVFFRTDKARNRPGDSSGLGLSIAKRIIEGHGGSVSARNDDGFIISIKLPIRRIER